MKYRVSFYIFMRAVFLQGLFFFSFGRNEPPSIVSKHLLLYLSAVILGKYYKIILRKLKLWWMFVLLKKQTIHVSEIQNLIKQNTLNSTPMHWFDIVNHSLVLLINFWFKSGLILWRKTFFLVSLHSECCFCCIYREIRFFLYRCWLKT